MLTGIGVLPEVGKTRAAPHSHKGRPAGATWHKNKCHAGAPSPALQQLNHAAHSLVWVSPLGAAPCSAGTAAPPGSQCTVPPGARVAAQHTVCTCKMQQSSCRVQLFAQVVRGWCAQPGSIARATHVQGAGGRQPRPNPRQHEGCRAPAGSGVSQAQ